MQTFKPSKNDLIEARGKIVPDIIDKNLSVLFCGINPGLYTAAIGCHFGRPGNRFWQVLYHSGFTPHLFSPYEQNELLPLGYGITNVVARATATADELSEEELMVGGEILTEKVNHFAAKNLAILGVGAYQKAFQQPKAKVGLQGQMIGQTRIWVLPNPSGLNAHYQKDHLIKLFTELKKECTS